uniref:Putative secretory peptide-11 n=1 Tax=Pleurobrachia bachei TaxID=34499 RepID=M4H259_PLEBA|nr:putative secretory peptide-11 [Pleurobrachia bachei]|eukprot:sb/3475466/
MIRTLILLAFLVATIHASPYGTSWPYTWTPRPSGFTGFHDTTPPPTSVGDETTDYETPHPGVVTSSDTTTSSGYMTYRDTPTPGGDDTTDYSAHVDYFSSSSPEQDETTYYTTVICDWFTSLFSDM